MRLTGSFFKALSAKQIKGEIELHKETASITSSGVTVCSGASIQSIQDKQNIYLSNGYLFTLNEPLTQEQERHFYGSFNKGIIWLEKFSVSRALALSLALIASLIILRYSLTAITPFVVSIFPQKWEKTIGQNTYDALEKTVFNKTELPAVRIDRLRERASEIARLNGFERPEVLFHQSELIGTNALAFPRGPIVITDDLVLLLEHDDLILSVIAHELAHIQQRHSLQQIIEVIGVAAIASVLLGSDDTLIEEASVVGVNLWASKKSRGFEKEADLLALEYIEKAGFSTSSFGLAIKKLTSHFCTATTSTSSQNCLENTKSGWLSSHPSGGERLKYINANS